MLHRQSCYRHTSWLVLVMHGCSADRELGCYLHAEPPRYSRELPCLAARHRLLEADFTGWYRSERSLVSSLAGLAPRSSANPPCLCHTIIAFLQSIRLLSRILVTLSACAR